MRLDLEELMSVVIAAQAQNCALLGGDKINGDESGDSPPFKINALETKITLSFYSANFF